MSRVFALGVLAAFAACSTETGPSIKIVVAQGALDSRCVGPSGRAGETPPSAAGITTLRITVRKHAANDPVGSFACDRVLRASGSLPHLRLPVMSAETIDLYAEGWKEVDEPDNAILGKFRRVAVGSLLNVPLKSPMIGPLRLYPAEQFNCADTKLTRARGFHSATALPNGQVLLAGGVVASPTDAAAETLQAPLLYLTGSVEIWDPATGKAVAITADPMQTPRAFHYATLLTRTPPYDILLVGGVTLKDPVADAASPALGLANAGLSGPRLVPFDTTQTVPTVLPTMAASSEILRYFPATKSIDRIPVAEHAAAAFVAGTALGDGYAVAGGINWGDPLNTTMPVKSVAAQRDGEAAARIGMIQTARLGATLSPIGDGNLALIYGGALSPADPIGEVVTGLGAEAMPSTMSVTAMGALMTQFHTATVLESGTTTRLVVSGGFQVEMGGNAQQPPAPIAAVRLVTVEAGGVTTVAPVMLGNGYQSDASTCTNDARYRPSGWESAVAIGRQRILISGGAPRFTSACIDCDERGSASLLCSIRQASLYDANRTEPFGPARPLQIGRFGHASTLLTDGSVLVTGGISLPQNAQSPRVVADVEIYNPRPERPPYDATMALPTDGDDPIAIDLVNDALLRAPGVEAEDPNKFGRPAKRCGDL